MHDTSSSPAGPTHTRWLIFALACATSWFLYLHRYSWGVVRPSLKAENLDLTDTQLGWLDAMFNLTYAIGQVPGGLAGDLAGPRTVLTIFILSWSGCVAWLAAGRGFLNVATIRAAFGLAQAGAYPCLSQVTRRWFPLDVRTTIQGLVASLSGRAGGACASLIVATLLMGWLGLTWRAAMLVLAAGGIVLAACFWLGFRNSPREHPMCNLLEVELIAGRPISAVNRERRRIQLQWEHMVTLTALAVYSIAATFADQLYVFWIPQYLEEYKGLTKSQMGLFAGLPLLGGALGGAVGGGLNDLAIRLTGNRRLGRSAVAFTGKTLAAMLIASSLFVDDGRWVMVVLFGCKFFCDWSLSTVWGAITDIGGPASGTLFGTLNAIGAAAGFIAGPVMGWLKQEHGFDLLFLTVAGMYALAGACWLFIDSRCRLWSEKEHA
jgi:sugar phosphate permease